jgi:protein SCO1/2
MSVSVKDAMRAVYWFTTQLSWASPAAPAGAAYDDGALPQPRHQELPEVRSTLRIWILATIGLAVAATVGAVVWLTMLSAPPVTGTELSRPVPDVALVDQHGTTVTLSDVRGKVVVIYPFLTACHEVCPMTTGAFVQMSDAIHAAGLSDRVALWEVTVDPERDTPQRLAAYADLVSADWTMLTGTPANLERFWSFFGVISERTDVASPAPVDWYTHQPETYDVGHTPALLFVDAQGRWRILVVGTADLGGTLPAVLGSMLNDEGRHSLEHPAAPWTVRQALDNVGFLLGRRIPSRSGS